jgi:hypothetical protein
VVQLLRRALLTRLGDGVGGRGTRHRWYRRRNGVRGARGARRTRADGHRRRRTGALKYGQLTPFSGRESCGGDKHTRLLPHRRGPHDGAIPARRRTRGPNPRHLRLDETKMPLIQPCRLPQQKCGIDAKLSRTCRPVDLVSTDPPLAGAALAARGPLSTGGGAAVRRRDRGGRVIRGGGLGVRARDELPQALVLGGGPVDLGRVGEVAAREGQADDDGVLRGRGLAGVF